MRSPHLFTSTLAFALLCLTAARPAPLLAGAAQGEPKTLDSRYRGLVVPSKQVLLVAPLDGIIAHMKVKKNDVVKAGDTLAVMDDEIQRLVVEAAKLRADSKAALTAAELAVQDAFLDVERAEKLFLDKAITKLELEKRHVFHKTKIAEQEAAKEQIALAVVNQKLEEAKLRKHSMLAPFDGTIVDIVTEEGASLARNDKVISMMALRQIEARINLPNTTEHVNHMRANVGKPFRMMAGEPVNREITGTLKSMRDVIDSGSATFLCEFTIDNPELKMPVGFSVDLLWPQ
jgi:RND family efflux transporter MFP subunit